MYVQRFSFKLIPTLSIEMKSVRAMSSKLLFGMALVLGGREVSFTQTIKPFSGWQSVHSIGTSGQPYQRPVVEGERSIRKPLSIQLAATADPKMAASKKVWSWNLFLWWVVVFLLAMQAGELAAGSMVVCFNLVVSSALAGLVTLREWMRKGGVISIERGMMAHFACRGATLAVLLSFLLEMLLPSLINLFSPNLAFFLDDTGAMGAVEELAKFLSLIWLSWSTMKPQVGRWQPSRRWPRSQKGIMLAGFSIGVGMMVVENAHFFGSSVFGLVSELKRAIIQENVFAVDDFFQGLASLFVFRIVLNPHPYLTGIAAGRFVMWLSKNSKRRSDTQQQGSTQQKQVPTQKEGSAQQKEVPTQEEGSAQQKEGSTQPREVFTQCEEIRLNFMAMCRVLWPSIVLHALLNTVVIRPGGIAGLLLRVLGCLICWMAFNHLWNTLEAEEHPVINAE